jgi:hypothetical protein
MFLLCIAGKIYIKQNSLTKTKNIYTLLIAVNFLSTCFYILCLLMIDSGPMQF